MNKTAKNIAYYMTLPYTIVLRRDGDNDVVARVEELPGCVGHGSDEAEAIEELRGMQRLWLEDCVASGHTVPLPASESELPSGKWVQRVPRSLHRRLAEMAKRESVSLNQMVTSLLAQAAGGDQWERPAGSQRYGGSLGRMRQPACTDSAGKKRSTGDRGG
jgi:antitoxin HicB